MVAINTIRSIVLLVGVLVLSFFSPAGAKTQNTLDVVSIDAYIENHMAEHQIPGLDLSIDDSFNLLGNVESTPLLFPLKPQYR